MTQTRKQHWEHVYQNKTPLEVSWYQTRPQISLEMIAACNLSADARLIDVGGGASTLVDHLLDLGYVDLSVLDISSAALDHARSRLGQRADSVQWIVSDVTGFTPASAFDLWHDRAVFHFLIDEQDRACYRDVLTRAVVPGGHIVIAAFAPDGPTQCSGLPICRYDAASLTAELGPKFTLVDERREVHITPAGKEQAFGFYRFQYTD